MQERIKIDEIELTKDEVRYTIVACKITFFNLGSLPVKVGKIPIPAGGVYQVNYEHPHLIEHNFQIIFDTAATPVSPAVIEELRLVSGPYLVIQKMHYQ